MVEICFFLIDLIEKGLYNFVSLLGIEKILYIFEHFAAFTDFSMR